MELKNIITDENHSINTDLCGIDFTINADRNVYNHIRKKYKLLALEAREKFSEMFDEFEDIEDLIENSPSAFILSCEKSLLEIVKDIISVDIYTIDKQTVIDMAFKGVYFDEFSSAHAKYSKKYQKILADLNDAEFARERRKESRSRWQVTTIGGSAMDAWSNQMDVNIMNFQEGVAHSIVNAIGNAIDRANAKSKLKDLFESKVLKQEMIDSVYDSCFNIHLLLISIVRENSEIKLSGAIDEGNSQKAKVMLNNLMDIELSEEKRLKFIEQIFELDPYEADHYRRLIIKYGDKDNSLGKFAEYHGVNSVIVKNHILAEYTKKNLGETEDDAHNCQKLMEQRAEEIGLKTEDISTSQDIIDEQLRELDIIYRTVDGILIDTRENADLAKEELKQINEIMDSITPATNDSTLSYEKDVIEKREKIDSFKTEIKKKYLDKIDVILKDFDKKFRKEGFFSTGLTREEAGKQRALSFAKTLNVSSYEELDRSTEKMKAFLPEVGLDEEKAADCFTYLKGCEARLNTVDGVPFSDREAAAKGREELKEISSIMSKVQPPQKDSLLDYEQGLMETREELLKFKTDIKVKYIETINGYLSKFDGYFRQTGTFQKAETREQAAQVKALKLVKSIAPDGCGYNEVDNAAKTLNDTLPKLGITLEQAYDATQYLNTQEARLNTVDGLVFDSREKAAAAREEYNQIQSIMSAVNKPGNDPLLSEEKRLFEAQSKLNSLQTDVRNKYLSIISEYLTIFDEKFRKVSLIKTCATREEAAKERALKFVKSRTYNTVQDVAAARQELVQYLPELGISIEQADSAAAYLKNTEDKLNGVAPESKLKGLFGRFKK